MRILTSYQSPRGTPSQRAKNEKKNEPARGTHVLLVVKGRASQEDIIWYSAIERYSHPVE